MTQQLKQLAILLCFAWQHANAQHDNPCNFQWGQLERVFTHSMGSVSIRVQTAACGKYGVCGWPKIAILHTFSGQDLLVDVSLKGTDCDGAQHVSNFVSSSAPNVENRSQANWHTFRSVQEAVAVHISFKRGDDFYQIDWDLARNVNRTLKNNSLLLSNGKTADEMAKEKELQEAEKEKAAKVAEENKRKEENDKKQAAAAKEKQQKEETDRRAGEAAEAQKKEDAAREQKRIDDSISWAQRDTRVENVQQQEASNAAVANQMSAGVVGIMFNDNLQDRDFEGRFLGWRALIGIGIENFPSIENFVSGSNARLNSSSLTSIFPFTATGGLQVSLFNKKYWRLSVTPQGQFGVTYGGGSIGYYYSYGAEGCLSVGNMIRLELGGGYYQQNVTQQTDADASNQAIGLSTNTNDQYYTNFKHYLVRAMAGFSFRFRESFSADKDKPQYGYLYIGAFADRPQYFEAEADKPVPGMEIRYKAPGGFYIKGLYASNYPFSGNAKYKIDERKNGAYFSVTFGKIFSLSK